jgi:peptide/nickel transport system ATP-binding protein
MIMGAYRPTAGHIWFQPPNGDERLDLAEIDPSEMKPLRRHIQMVFQDPFASLNPRMTVRQILAEPLVVNKIARGRDLEGRVRELVELVGLRVQHLNRYPHAFSGGQRQRMARALKKKINIAPISAPVKTAGLDKSTPFRPTTSRNALNRRKADNAAEATP